MRCLSHLLTRRGRVPDLHPARAAASAPALRETDAYESKVGIVSRAGRIERPCAQWLNNRLTMTASVKADQVVVLVERRLVILRVATMSAVPIRTLLLQEERIGPGWVYEQYSRMRRIDRRRVPVARGRYPGQKRCGGEVTAKRQIDVSTRHVALALALAGYRETLS